ncbi:MAG TPA: hypothetical protein VM555_07380 [Tahibacter sp.]|nr:hypothetical protein [Tahibacter sp.]
MNDFKKRYRRAGSLKGRQRKPFGAIEATASVSVPKMRLSDALSALDLAQAAAIARRVELERAGRSYRLPIPERAAVKKVYREIAELQRNVDTRENRKHLKDALARLRQLQGWDVSGDADGSRRSADALDRARDRLLKPGISLGAASTVPRFHADPGMPGRLIRILGGKKEAGYFIDGEFKLAQ